MWHIQAMVYYSAINKNEILPFFDNLLMDLEDFMLNEVGQTEKGKYHTISLI